MNKQFKSFVLLLCLIVPAVWSTAKNTYSSDGQSHIQIKEAKVQSVPKGYTIQASLTGHYLTVAFTENLGQVAIEITTATGDHVQTDSCLTPNGLQFFIPLVGDYVVTFTLPNGDEYYGEFTVSD